ncbi:MAG: serine/threonine protein kinase [Pirellulales bacterium]|nr:serine/threonine protein kinase [Pirellulales bacterium]
MQPQQLGPYRIGARIGKGGMGAVYAGVDETTGQAVAVKALSPHLALAEGFRERFEAEIESLKKLQHDSIVRMYGYGEDAGVLFYSMERVDGPSLEDELRDGRRFDWRETLSIAVQLCRALKHAHDHGVVHRDIKPANILVCGDGRVKLADFGIARLFGASQLTTAGGVLGTADYMSPEQADGRPVTDKCDQYSLGCVMYALLAGRPPFRAKTMPEMLQLQRYADPEPVRRYAPETPQQLNDLILQLLSKEPEDRFPNVRVLGRHMEAMVFALSRSKADSVPATSEQPAAGAPRDATSAGGQDATLAGEAISLITVDTGAEGLYDAPTLAEDDKSLAPPPTTSAPTTPRPSRFTTVDEEARRAARVPEEASWMHWASLAGLVAALAAIGYVGWRITRPPSADELYGRVVAAISEDRAAGMRDHRDDVAAFLKRYPDDPRAGEFAKLQEEIDVRREASRLRVGARLGGGDDLPASRWFAAAMAAASTDPAGAAATLENALRLYGVDPRDDDNARFDDPELSLDPAERKWLRVIDLELRRLRESLDETVELQRPLVAERLSAARKLAATHPEEAQRIYQGIVGLYAAHEWAEEAVREATQALESLGASGALPRTPRSRTKE